MSRNKKRQVTRRLKIVTNIMRRSLPIIGSMKRPTFTVPEEQRQARHAIEDICNRGLVEKLETVRSTTKMLLTVSKS